MKKPTKKPRMIRTPCDIFEPDGMYTPEDLRTIANELESREASIDIYRCWDTIEVEELRYETPDEAEIRYKKDMKQYERFKKEQEKKKQIGRQI